MNHFDFAFKFSLLIRFSPVLEKIRIKGKYYVLNDATKKIMRWRNMAVTASFLLVLLLGEMVFPHLNFLIIVLLALVLAIMVACLLVFTISDQSLEGMVEIPRPIEDSKPP